MSLFDRLENSIIKLQKLPISVILLIGFFGLAFIIGIIAIGVSLHTHLQTIATVQNLCKQGSISNLDKRYGTRKYTETSHEGIEGSLDTNFDLTAFFKDNHNSYRTLCLLHNGSPVYNYVYPTLDNVISFKKGKTNYKPTVSYQKYMDLTTNLGQWDDFHEFDLNVTGADQGDDSSFFDDNEHYYALIIEKVVVSGKFDSIFVIDTGIQKDEVFDPAEVYSILHGFKINYNSYTQSDTLDYNPSKLSDYGGKIYLLNTNGH